MRKENIKQTNWNHNKYFNTIKQDISQVSPQWTSISTNIFFALFKRTNKLNMIISVAWEMCVVMQWLNFDENWFQMHAGSTKTHLDNAGFF